MTVIDEIAAERRRQIEQEGWIAEHDDEHADGEIARAAAAYALAELPERYGAPNIWPWSLQGWKPKGRRRNLVRAGALIVAEIERLDRETETEAGNGNPTP